MVLGCMGALPILLKYQNTSVSLVSGISMPGRNSECVLVTKDTRASMFSSDSA